MAFPAVQEAIESSTNTAGTSHVVTLPTATAGQLLLIILDKGSTSATVNALTGLTELLDENSANGLYIAYRWMDGTEPASYTLTTSASTRSARIAYRISGAENPATTAPQIGTTATGTSATPDPPASATPPSTKDYLFIAFAGMAGEEADDDTWGNTPPTNYTPNPPRQKSCGTAGTNLGGLILSAERQLNTGSAENPGTFGVDVSAAWRAQTITIHPRAPVTHAATGTLSAGTGTVAGSASSATTRAASGILAGSGVTLAGAAARTRAHTSTGALAGQGSEVVGSADRQDGPAFVTHDASGTLEAAGAEIVGSASSATTRSSSGYLAGPGSAVEGSSARFRAFAADGALTGAGTVLEGSAARVGAPVTHDAEGALAGAGAQIVAEAELTAVTVGGAVPGRSKRKYLVTYRGARFMVPEDDLDNWLERKIEAAEPAPKTVRAQKQEKIPEIFTTPAPEIRAFIDLANIKFAERAAKRRPLLPKRRLLDQDDEEAVLLIL